MKGIKKSVKEVIKWIVRGAIYIWLKIYYRADIRGLENIPKEGALIFCGNHRSYLDPPLIVVTGKRDMKFLAKEELYKNKFLAFLGWAFEAIPVKRDEKDVSAIKNSLKVLKNGECIALFPEGTRNGIAKGKKVKKGAVMIAATTQSPIIPIGVQGTFKPFRRVTINIGKPIDYAQYKKETKDKEKMQELANELMEEIIKLRDDEKGRKALSE